MTRIDAYRSTGPHFPPRLIALCFGVCKSAYNMQYIVVVVWLVRQFSNNAAVGLCFSSATVHFLRQSSAVCMLPGECYSIDWTSSKLLCNWKWPFIQQTTTETLRKHWNCAKTARKQRNRFAKDPFMPLILAMKPVWIVDLYEREREWPKSNQ